MHLEIHASTCISAKLKKHTYTYELLQFPAEMNTRGSFYSFSHKVWFTGPDLWIFTQLFLNIMLWLQNNFSMLQDFKTDNFEH